MFSFERADLNTFPWEETHAGLGDRTLFQSPAWLDFLTATQKGEAVVAVLRNGSAAAGYFTGMIVRKLGLKVLGSPFPGWSTSYMGLNLSPGISKHSVLDALKRLAFDDLHCSHLEFMDRKFNAAEISECGFQSTSLNGFEVDLTATEEEIFERFRPACRQAIRKATRSGVTVAEAADADFAAEYYSQLEEVFGRQKLAPTYSLARVQDLLRYIQPTGKLLLLRARDGHGQCIATGIFLMISPTTMYFWGGASWSSHQSLRPNDLLMWKAMQIGKARGMAILDLGGAGDYKKKFGGRPISVPWARISSQPFIPILRDTARTLFRLKQRLQARGGWKSPGQPAAIPTVPDVTAKHL
ncbi:MAG TPA: GNAT family N-acetyltransferase [Candidatus Angelobacter sp.]|nr:GNAT family N-acetyltransferase [Candidatus Angelobacter sp.]